MNLNKINLQVAKKYIAKNNIENKNNFYKAYNNIKEECSPYLFIKSIKNIDNDILGSFLHVVTNYLLKNTMINKPKEVNNFVEKVSSIELNEYISLLKKSKKDVIPIKMNAITIKTSEKYLRQKSKKVDFKDKNISHDIKVLEDYCQNGGVLAMAAVQLGIPKRIIYIKNTNLELVNKFQNNSSDKNDIDYNEQRVLINPKIIKEKGLTEYWEACASCLDNMGHIYRPYEIEIEYYDLQNRKQKVTFKGFESTVLSHEYDHLNGILHMDKADEVLVMEAAKRGEFRQTHKYNIICKDKDYIDLLKDLKK